MSAIYIYPHELRRMLNDAAELAVQRYRIDAGKERGYISKSEAYRRYGRHTVDRWIREGLVKQSKDGVKNMSCRLPADQLEAAAKTSNYASFFGSMKAE
jgi:hypothetical protein